MHRCVMLYRYADWADATGATRKSDIKRVYHRQRDPNALTSVITPYFFFFFFYPTTALTSAYNDGAQRYGHGREVEVE